MNLDKTQLIKMVRDAPQSQILAMSVSPITKDSTKTAIIYLTKYLEKRNNYTIIAIKT